MVVEEGEGEGMRKGEEKREEEEECAVPDDASIFAAVKSYVDTYGLVRAQIDSFNHFLEVLLPLIIQENSDVTSVSPCRRFTYHAQWTNVVIMPPTSKESCGFEKALTPDAARMRSLTYSSNVVCDLVHDCFDQETSPPTHVFRRVYRETVLARVPIMLGCSACHLRDPARRSAECPNDPLGYFLVNGSEKTLLSQEKLRTNTTFVFPSKSYPKYTHYAECRSCHELKLRSTSTLLLHATPPRAGFCDVLVELPFVKQMVPLASMFKILGVASRDEVLELVQADDDPLLRHTLCSIFEHDAQSDMSRDEVLDWLGREGTTEGTREKRQKFLCHILSNECLPHMALRMDASSFRKKAHYLAHMTRRLLRVCHGACACDDRDDYQIKRVDSSGVMMGLLFRQLWRSFLKSVSAVQGRMIEKGTIGTANFGDAVVQKKITSGLKYAFSTGNWGQKNRGGQTGVAQILSRMTALSAISQLRRINCPISREGRLPKPRMLHTTSYGLTCPVETPEGAACGLVKNLTLLCHLRVGSAFTAPIAEVVLSAPGGVPVTPLLRATAAQRRGDASVLINGVIVGYAPRERAGALAEAVRALRRRGALPFDLSVALQDNEVHVMTDPGAMLAPCIRASEAGRFADVVRACPPHACAWDRLLAEGVVEYLDKCEEQELKVALAPSDLLLTPRSSASSASSSASSASSSASSAPFTHAHLHPSLCLGVCAALVPLCEFNQSPRNTYQSAMSKQAIGFYVTNLNHRMDTVAHVRVHAQTPLVATAAERILGAAATPAGENCVIAIACYTGFNQEDSVIVSQSSIDRGLFRSLVYRTYRDEEKRSGADAEAFENPSTTPNVSGVHHGGYAKLGPGGVVRLGERLETGDALIGKTIATADLSAEPGHSRSVVKRCKSTFLRSDEPCVVDAALSTTTRDGHRMRKVRTRALRIPGIGDKVASRSGQKGVIGVVLRDDDMPRSDDGVVPDLIMNPHAIPSRMTIAHLLEQLLGRACCEEGRLGDATPFRGVDPEAIADLLEERGFARYGQARLTNGVTGEQMTSLVVQGPVFYQKLKHMVIDKMHSRSRGPLAFLTRQPIEGRSRDGGLRIGEMERDCIISHGAMSVMKDRLMECSDPFVAPVCRTCGLLCDPARQTAVGTKPASCRACGDKCAGVVSKAQPYAFKLLQHELMAMHIAPRVRLEGGEEEGAA